ncbi:MAG TPA: hypothetical protein VFL96_16215 [Acidobacteriaceae bacterium]|nr:hypothetical protein [Acidobacteriaceae bacterium]
MLDRTFGLERTSGYTLALNQFHHGELPTECVDKPVRICRRFGGIAPGHLSFLPGAENPSSPEFLEILLLLVAGHGCSGCAAAAKSVAAWLPHTSHWRLGDAAATNSFEGKSSA